MELTLKRHWLTEASTVGALEDVTPDTHGAPVWLCYILEDRYRPAPEAKVPGATCIPPGRYEVRITHSPKFGVEMPLLIGVPGFEGVRIHPGNDARDTEGCLLPGRVRHGESVGESRAAYVDLLAHLRGASGPIWLTITVEGAPICL
jgi:hypothetical protein